jgi:hypothetical protein
MIKKKIQDDFVLTKIPREFLEVVDMRIIADDFGSRAEFLRVLGKKIRPTANDLKSKGLIRKDDEEDNDEGLRFDKFDFIPPQI